MFGIKKFDLVNNLCKLACRHCSYTGNTCDCKYIQSSDKNEDISIGSERGSGCPECMLAASIIGSMTDQEYYMISKRAGITIHDAEKDNFINVIDIIKKHKAERDKNIFKKPIGSKNK